MDNLDQVVVFTLDEQRYALDLSVVERIVRIVEITPLPKAPEIVEGIINVQGKVVPVFNVRKRFRLPERETDLSDQLIIAHTSGQVVALAVDSVTDVLQCSGEQITVAENVLPGLEYVAGVARFKDGMILIHNLDDFLSLDEEKKLSGAIEETAKRK